MPGFLSHLGIAEEMEWLERYMQDLVQSPILLLSDPARHILTAGGKRLRAAIVFLTARLGREVVSEEALYAAASIELVHAASLVHDDLIDQSPHRRGRPTIHNKWHHDAALLTGDYLFALSARAIARTSDVKILADISNAATAICEGEICSVDGVEPLEEALEAYDFKIGHKTAALFEAAARVGARCGGMDESTIESLGRFGYALGMSFQIVDDILDYVGDEQVLGKPAGGDLRRGLITLPLIYAVAYDDRDLFLRGVVSRFGDGLGPDDIAEALQRVCNSSGPLRAQEKAEACYQEALQHLQKIAHYPTYTELETVAVRAVKRTF